ncbi:MAG: hypothetical protein QM703_12115 [Gemmatales bacterium]
MQRLIAIIVILLVIGLVATGLYLVIFGPQGVSTQVKVAVIPSGDQEAAWLHPATNIATWERFVAGLRELPNITVDDSAAFPEDSMKLPVVGLRRPGVPGTLWIRWYKLTGRQRTIEMWVNELCERQPPPLAIVGGGNSERARDIAMHLSRRQQKEPAKRLPAFLITTATADKVQNTELGEVDLMKIYPQRSFRYCFTNKQMAEAICDFVRDEINRDRNLQVSSPLISLVSWHDDPFSEDLVDQFEEQWKIPNETTVTPEVKKYVIAHSVGGLNRANKLEVAAVGKLVRDAGMMPTRGREILVLPGGPAPARRFLRSLYRTDPLERHFWVVTVADAIDWNTLYRDRRLTWPVEDIPFPLIAFMHRNPVETKLGPGRGFVADSSTTETPNPTGTDDLLLYRDIGQSLVNCCFRDANQAPRLIDNPEELIKRLNEEKDAQGQSLFDDQGNRPGRGGEYITLLEPLYEGMQVLPKSKIKVYERLANSNDWRKITEFGADYSSSRGQP